MSTHSPTNLWVCPSCGAANSFSRRWNCGYTHEQESGLDVVDGPEHYTAGGIESIDVMQAKMTPEQFEGFLLGNIMKYAHRFNHKGLKKESAGKIRWYASKLEEVLSDG